MIADLLIKAFEAVKQREIINGLDLIMTVNKRWTNAMLKHVCKGNHRGEGLIYSD